jgi:ZIP family zinc transporter
VEFLVLVAAATGTAVATGLGAIPVYMLGERAKDLTPFLLGFAAGVMSVASLLGLLLPALDEGAPAEVAGGFAAGVAFLLVSRRLLREPELEGNLLSDRRTAILVFLVLFVHSLPEGFAIGTAYASETTGLGLFVIVAIAAQNVPEGTSVAVPMAAAGYGRSQQFWAAVGTSAPQPVGAVIAYVLVEQVQGLLALSFAFAAGAMLALVAIELAPKAFRSGNARGGTLGAAVGALLMIALSALLQV